MMRALDQMQVRETLLERIRAGMPFLGICLGLQALFESSEEAPGERGLGLFPGEIRRFPASARVPHMGWNEIEPGSVERTGAKLLADLGPHPYLYFAHSYYAPLNDATAATCRYNVSYTAVLETKSIFGVQFHPEKSGPLGLKIVRNFIDL
jgi:imidazole glycerol phosphate synthase glutamine amidotransferase subunit